jgi:hypothetical protein
LLVRKAVESIRVRSSHMEIPLMVCSCFQLTGAPAGI